MTIGHILEHTVWLDPIRPNGAVVFDCGANRGDFAEWACATLNAAVYSFEADPELAKHLPLLPRTVNRNWAVAGADGSMTFSRAPDRCTSAFFNGSSSDCFTIAARSLDSIQNEFGISHIDLLKLDIEGAEVGVLEKIPDSFLACVGQITCEFHDFLDASQTPQIKKILKRMRQSGFVVLKMSFWSYGDVLMVNRAFHPVTMRDLLVFHCDKYRRGTARTIKRFLGRFCCPTARLSAMKNHA
ncbi:MAG: FkbM family methyltransferase [Planctomycetia bacterium]|nr:FkbM family methyltransferase [Planctomycetia bacterium]